MFVALGITFFYVIFVWFVFFKARWLRFNIAWGVVSFWVGAHLLLIFLVALRFFQPFSLDSHVIRSTIQIVPRLTQPTLLTEVLVEPNVPVKKGDPLYRFDKAVYQAQADAARAQLAAAEQNVEILKQDVAAAGEAVERAQAQLAYATAQQARYADLVPQGGARQDELDRWNEQVTEASAAVKEADANHPQFGLSGSIGWEASAGRDLFQADSLTWTYSPGIAWNVLNYGRLRNNVRAQDAEFQALVANYQNTVLAAYSEVENAMVAYDKGRSEAAYLQRSVEASRRAAELALSQYTDGVADYSRVIDAQQASLLAEANLVEARAAVSENLVALYKALGGGWEVRRGREFLPDEVLVEMAYRTDWGDLL
jgi:Outer membrane efflux protein/Biotin-lipoyl like